MNRLLSVAILACGLLAGLAQAKELTIVGVEEPPGSFGNAAGQARGLSVDVVEAIQRRVGNKDPITIVPESDALEWARSRPNVVAFSFTRNAEREDQFHWIVQVIRKPWVVYALKGNTAPVASLDDMRKLGRIGVVDGDVRTRWLQKEKFANLTLVADPSDNIQQLLAGKVDAIFYEPAGVAFYCQKLQCGKDRIASLYSPKASDVYVLMSKGTPDSTVKAWQDAAAVLKADGTLDKIARKWVLKSAVDYGIDSMHRDGVVHFR